MTQYLITSALPYVNNVPHLGNLIGSTLSADFYARYCRLKERKVLFVCGSDCYGTASEVKAKEAGVTPAELCDKYHAIHKQIYEWFGISFDIYGKTSTPIHTEIVKDISLDLDNGGYLESQSVQQLYCTNCDISLADRYVKGTCPHCRENAKGDQCDATNCGKILHAINLVNPVCVICGAKPETRDSEHIFLSLNKCQPQLEKWIMSCAESLHWTTNAVGITQSWLMKGLEPRCITRNLKWGTPVPHLLHRNWGKVFYVWYDAPIGYISITACERDDWKEWWQNPQNTRLYQFMAKDNVPFHTVMFPALLQATEQNWTLVTNICATEYLNYENKKFSKSNSIGIFGDAVQEMGIPADYWRYYLATIRPEKSDSNFDRNGFKLAIDDLSDKFGNLVQRVLTLIKKYCNGRPVCTDATTDDDVKFMELIEGVVSKYHTAFDNVRIIAALQYALQVAQETNKYLYIQEPWKITDNSDRRVNICITALYATHLTSLLLSPITPTIHDQFCKYLHYDPKATSLDLENVYIDSFKPLIDKTCTRDL